jgi:hypothetical protein
MQSQMLNMTLGSQSSSNTSMPTPPDPMDDNPILPFSAPPDRNFLTSITTHTLNDLWHPNSYIIVTLDFPPHPTSRQLHVTSTPTDDPLYNGPPPEPINCFRLLTPPGPSTIYGSPIISLNCNTQYPQPQHSYTNRPHGHPKPLTFTEKVMAFLGNNQLLSRHSLRQTIKRGPSSSF